MNALTNLNKEKRNDIDADKNFLLGLLVGLYTTKRIKESENIDEPILDFMKGNSENIHKKTIERSNILFFVDLFKQRVSVGDSDGKRLESFQRLIDVSCENIRENRV